MKYPFCFFRCFRGVVFSLLTLTAATVWAAPQTLNYSQPPTDWQSQGLPIGNGSLGGVMMGDAATGSMQFNVDSLWTGDENPRGQYDDFGLTKAEAMGAYQNFGKLEFEHAFGKDSDPQNYRRELNLADAIHSAVWEQDGVTFSRSAIASFPDRVIAWHMTADAPGKISGTLRLTGAHAELEKVDQVDGQLRLRGKFPNGLLYEARVQILHQGGEVNAQPDSLECHQCDEITVLVAADTNYVMSREAGWMSGDPAEKTMTRLRAAQAKGWSSLLDAHRRDYQSLYNRVTLEIGESDPDVSALTTDKRIQRYRDLAQELPRPCLDPELESMLFHYGRYLLIASSRRESLPANLQGIWCNSNKPAWHCDFHSNINLQMNYWLAETTNLAELAEPLFALLDSGVPVYREMTNKEYGDTPGFVTRMSINPYGGSGWNWNIEGTAWLAQHYWEHYAFSNDRRFLEQQAWPWMRDVSQFWLARLKKLPNGELVVPNAWSHEHGPHEDGTAHAQQLMYDLFTNTLLAAKVLGIEPELQQQLAATLGNLQGPQIGSWGQLMEWMEEKPELEKSNHRHTSHLFAVYPGKQISLQTTPELATAAIVSLTQRGEVGDSRRSWTWAWRTALWSRLGQSDRAHGCVAGLLAHNTMENLWTTHPPFQIDGNLGVTAGIAEMLLQSHAGMLEILPALPTAWPTGKVTGLRARGGFTVDIQWKDNALTELTIHAPKDGEVTVKYGDLISAVSIKAAEARVLGPNISTKDTP